MIRFKIAGNFNNSYKRKEVSCRYNLSKSIDCYMYEKKVKMSSRKQHVCMVMNFQARCNWSACLRHYLIFSKANTVKYEVDSDTHP